MARLFAISLVPLLVTLIVGSTDFPFGDTVCVVSLCPVSMKPRTYPVFQGFQTHEVLMFDSAWGTVVQGYQADRDEELVFDVALVLSITK